MTTCFLFNCDVVYSTVSMRLFFYFVDNQSFSFDLEPPAVALPEKTHGLFEEATQEALQNRRES